MLKLLHEPYEAKEAMIEGKTIEMDRNFSRLRSYNPELVQNWTKYLIALVAWNTDRQKFGKEISALKKYLEKEANKLIGKL